MRTSQDRHKAPTAPPYRPLSLRITLKDIGPAVIILALVVLIGVFLKRKDVRV